MVVIGIIILSHHNIFEVEVKKCLQRTFAQRFSRSMAYSIKLNYMSFVQNFLDYLSPNRIKNLQCNFLSLRAIRRIGSNPHKFPIKCHCFCIYRLY